MTNNINSIRAATDAFDTIDRITRCDCIETLPRTRNCFHTLAARSLRDLLIDRSATLTDSDFDFDDDRPLATTAHELIRSLLAIIDDAPYMTDRLSHLALSESLCPMHFIDYAICFDDDDDECAAIRACFPSHDT